MIEDWFKKKLNVPENWDKYDYESHRYSFNDMVDFAEQYHTEQCAMHDVVGLSEQLSQCKCGNTVQVECDDCKDDRIRSKYM